MGLQDFHNYYEIHDFGPDMDGLAILGSIRELIKAEIIAEAPVTAQAVTHDATVPHIERAVKWR
jgi:hypothetical protein